LLDGTLHDDERAMEHIADLTDWTPLIRRFGFKRELGQRDSACCRVANGVGE
jgi:hypothetical protein